MNELRERVLSALKNQLVGLTRRELEEALGERIEPQRLLRELRTMEKSGLISFQGKTRERRYLPANLAPLANSHSAIPLSPEAVAALETVTKPVQLRQPVSYDRAFLDAYVPQKTRYLPTERLKALGKTDAVHAPAGTHARNILERLLLDLSWNSARLEGNTYSFLDTERLLKEGTTASGKSAQEAQMLLNHKAAIEFLVAEPTTAVPTVKALHALLMENLLPESLDEGRIRSTPVQIGSSVYLPLANPQLIDECFRQLLSTAAKIKDAFECSFFLLIHLPYLQPFLDGNKRTARLAANLPLVAQNWVPLSFADVPRDLFLKAYLALYELRAIEPLRDIYVWAYERSVQRLGQVRKSLGEPDPFRLKYRAALRELIAEVVRENRRRKYIEQFAHERIPSADQSRFIAVVETELSNLHEGNFARYALRPSEFESWKKKVK